MPCKEGDPALYPAQPPDFQQAGAAKLRGFLLKVHELTSDLSPAVEPDFEGITA